MTRCTSEIINAMYTVFIWQTLNVIYFPFIIVGKINKSFENDKSILFICVISAVLWWVNMVQNFSDTLSVPYIRWLLGTVHTQHIDQSINFNT